MKKVITACIGNSILIILLALALIHPFSDVQNNENGVEVTFSIYVLIFVIYSIIFCILSVIVFKNNKKQFLKYSEFTFEDEREKIIVADATKFAYIVSICFLMISMVMLAVMKAISSTKMFHVEINIYSLSISLITMTICLAFITYCIRWCIEYKK
jgi:hypothetical protein